MVITEAELRELWRDGRNPLPAFPPGTRFTPAAQDFLKAHGLEVRFEAPRPEPQTQTPAAAKGLPPALRARLDSLHAWTQLAAAEARRSRLPELAGHLDALAAHTAALAAAAQAGGPLPALAEPLVNVPAGGLPGAHGAANDHVVLHWLRVLRATAVEIEQAAREAGPPLEADLAPALQHLANAHDRLARLFVAGPLGWRVGW